MNLSKLRHTLDNINAAVPNADTAIEIAAMRKAWDAFAANKGDMGGFRAIIEDRLELAESRQRRIA